MSMSSPGQSTTTKSNISEAHITEAHIDESIVETSASRAHEVRYGTLTVEGVEIAYREAGDTSHPKLVLLHGFPASSHQYRDLVRVLGDTFHVIAPDYPGFGNSSAPEAYEYTFDNLARTIESFLQKKGFERFGLYVQDYGGPVGFRIVGRRPESLQWLIIQNSNAYDEGFTAVWDGIRGALWSHRSAETEGPLLAFLTRQGIQGIYLHGMKHPELVSPDNWESDYGFMQRPHAIRMNLDLFYDYRKNAALYPEWQRFLREQHPQTIVFWSQEDPFFTQEGGEAYLRDLPDAEMHRLESGHFAVEDSLEYIATHMRRFYAERVEHA